MTQNFCDFEEKFDEFDAIFMILASNFEKSTGLGEEGVERIITATDGLVGGHLAIRLDTVLEAVKLPATVTDLATGLALIAA